MFTDANVVLRVVGQHPIQRLNDLTDRPEPLASSTFSETSDASGAAPMRLPFESTPLPAMMPATCEP